MTKQNERKKNKKKNLCLSCMEHFNVPGLSLFIRDDVTL